MRELILGVVVVVVVIVVVFCSSECSVYSQAAPFRTVFINSPNVAISYFLKTKLSEDDPCVKNFKGMPMDQREDLCREMLVNSTSFSIDSELTRPLDMKDLSDKIHKTFTAYPADMISFTDQSFTFEDSEFTQGIPAGHICVIDETGAQWAVGIMNHKDILILFHKPPHSEQFQISGLLEKMPNFSLQAEAKYLEKKNSAAESLELAEENRNSKTTFARLHPYDKLRLCALAHLAMLELEGEKWAPMNVVRIDENMHVAKILTDPATDPIFADLVPCAINEDLRNSRFSVTNDPSSMDSAFIVKPVRETRQTLKSEKIIGYRVALYLENVAVLETPSRQFLDNFLFSE